MQYVVCYDISDDGRRSRLANCLLDFGRRVEESVFVANLDGALALRMMERVKRLVKENEDRVHVFEMCSECAGKTVTLGDAEVVVDRDFYII